MFFKIGALKHFVNHTGKTPALGSPCDKTSSPQAHSFIKETATQALSRETQETSNNTPLYRTPPMTASGKTKNKVLV